jgi:nucleotide-binding universal stress UspA family protein
MKIDRVLVPLDGSPFGEMALPTALGLLSNHPHAKLILLRAVTAPPLPGIDPVEAQLAVVREAEDYLERVAARLRCDGVSRVKTSVSYSSAAPAIVEAAHARCADVIVMSTHGRSGLSRMIRGSVAESVVRSTRTPVLLVSAGDVRAEARSRCGAGHAARGGGPRGRGSASPPSRRAGEAAVRNRVLSRGQSPLAKMER